MDTETNTQEVSAIDRAIAVCEGIHALSEAAGVSVQAIYHWKSGVRVITAEYAKKIEIATGGKVTRADLRPDLFGA